MARQLNAITEEQAREQLVLADEAIARVEPGPAGFEKLARLHFDRGTLLHLVEAPEEDVARALRSAGELAVQQYEQASLPISTSVRNGYDLVQRVLGLVAAWCEPSWRERLGAVPEWSFEWQTPTMQFTPYLRLAREYFVGRVTLDELRERITALGDGSSPKKDNEGRLCLAGYRCMLAIDEKDEATFNKELEVLLSLHAYSTQKGAYRTTNEGLISMHAVWLATMAREKGLAVTVQSNYLTAPGTAAAPPGLHR